MTHHNVLLKTLKLGSIKRVESKLTEDSQACFLMRYIIGKLKGDLKRSEMVKSKRIMNQVVIKTSQASVLPRLLCVASKNTNLHFRLFPCSSKYIQSILDTPPSVIFSFLLLMFNPKLPPSSKNRTVNIKIDKPRIRLHYCKRENLTCECIDK